MLNIKGNAFQTLINFLILPAGLAFCYGLAWLSIIYPHQDKNEAVLISLGIVLKFMTSFYISAGIFSIMWIVYMLMSLKQFKESKLYFALNRFILIFVTCLLVSAAILVLKPS
jgi:hypothetical protein